MARKTGLSRRMQKQGPPPALDETIPSKKRKLAAPAKSAVKKQKLQSRDEPPFKQVTKAKAATVQKPVANGARLEKAEKAALVKPPLPSDDDEIDGGLSDLSGDAVDDPDIMEDELDGVKEADWDDLHDHALDCDYQYRD